MAQGSSINGNGSGSGSGNDSYTIKGRGVVSRPKLVKEVEELKEVKNIHHIHVWQLDEYTIHLEAHVDLREDLKVSNTHEIQKKIENMNYLPFMITDTRTNTFVGLVDVKNIDWNVPKAELGSFIDANYESKGIVSKASQIMVDHIVKEHKFIKLLCRASSRNKGSIAVILKNGFELEGTIRKDYRTTKGEIIDLNYYGRVFNVY